MKPVFRSPNYHTKSLRSNPFPSHLYPDVGATFSRIILLASIIAHAKTERPILSSPLNVYAIRRFPSIVFNLLPGRKVSPTFLAFTQPDLPIFQFSVSLPCCFLWWTIRTLIGSFHKTSPQSNVGTIIYINLSVWLLERLGDYRLVGAYL